MTTTHQSTYTVLLFTMRDMTHPHLTKPHRQDSNLEFPYSQTERLRIIITFPHVHDEISNTNINRSATTKITDLHTHNRPRLYANPLSQTQDFLESINPNASIYLNHTVSENRRRYLTSRSSYQFMPLETTSTLHAMQSSHARIVS